jgi:RNA polymerase sigma-70 factor (family 1)
MTKEGLKYLLLNIAAGDAKAFRQIFDCYSPKIFHFALKLTHSRAMAEEIVQEIFMKVWNNREKLSEIEFFPSYLYTITKNYSFNVLKRIAIEASANAKLVARLPLHHSETEERIICTDYENLLGRIVDNLPPQQKKVYSLCHQEGLKYEEAAERLNISRLTVKTHMQSALRTIKSQFGHIIQYCMLCIALVS